MMISDEIIEKVRQSVDIVDIIGQYVTLKRAGTYYKGLSPFNKEKTPSFMVSPSKQSFKCYSSGNGGDVFKFLMLHEGMDFPEAVRFLAGKAGIEIPEERGNPTQSSQAKAVKETLFRLHGQLAAQWRDLLLSDPRAEAGRVYLKSRRIPESWIKDFCLGYALPDWDATIAWASKAGFRVENLLEAGLVIRNESGRTYDRFRERLMFPICNEQGQPIAFSGRILVAREDSPKYVNSPETPIFKKSRTLFGLDRAKRAILSAEEVIVCEGQLDVLRCHSAGVMNVVAPLGTAFTEEHLKILSRLAKRIILCLDADRAGQKTAARLGQMLAGGLDQGIEVLAQSDLGIQVVKLPEGHDPDSLITDFGGDAFKELVSKPMDYLDFFIDYQMKEEDETAAGRRRVVDQVSDLIGRVENAVVRDRLVEQSCRKLGVSSNVLRAEIERARAKKKPASTVESSLEAKSPVLQAKVVEVDPPIRDLLLLLLAAPQFIPEAQRRILPAWLEDMRGLALYEKMLDGYSNDEFSDFAGYLSILTSDEQNYVSGLDLEPFGSVTPQDFQKMLGTLTRRLHLDWLNRSLSVIANQLKQPNLVLEEKSRLIQSQFSLIKQKSDLTKPVKE